MVNSKGDCIDKQLRIVEMHCCDEAVKCEEEILKLLEEYEDPMESLFESCGVEEVDEVPDQSIVCGSACVEALKQWDVHGRVEKLLKKCRHAIESRSTFSDIIILTLRGVVFNTCSTKPSCSCKKGRRSSPRF
jgi:hypothetical protein